MKRFLMWIALVVLTGCAGSGQSSRLTEAGLEPTPGVLPLRLAAEADGDSVVVELNSPAACDLYQLAGGVSFDAAAYSFVSAEPGGAFGEDTESYFAAGETTPGQIDFAYTKRFHGPGVTGEAGLLRLEFEARGTFNAADFAIVTDPTAILARDSAKEPLEVQAGGGVQ